MKTKINAQIVAHSVNEQGDELISVLATFPRIILAEVNTHRMLSKNTSSSRAIPFKKMVETIKNDPFIPIAWQKEHKGMQGTEYLSEQQGYHSELQWISARNWAISCATLLNNSGTTKQLCNRLLEPFMWTTMLITGSREGWENFFNLRCPSYQYSAAKFRSKKDLAKTTVHAEDFTDLDFLKMNKGQAEIHIMELAECIWDAYNESTPKQLVSGQWHIPFADKISLGDLDQVKISVAMAARTSYTVVGEEKALDYEAMIGLHDRLLAQDPPHSSPLEHCAKAMSSEEYRTFIKGECEVNPISEEVISPVMNEGWCNNLKGFIPYRYLVDNEK